MTADIVLQLLIIGLNHTSELGAIYAKMKAEGRTDLTADEMALVRGKATAAQAAAQAVVDTMP